MRLNTKKTKALNALVENHKNFVLLYDAVYSDCSDSEKVTLIDMKIIELDNVAEIAFFIGGMTGMESVRKRIGVKQVKS